MPETSTRAAPVPVARRGGLHVVLFVVPTAGKSSLLRALVLVVAAADPPPADEDFAQFEQFLTLLEQSRGRRSDISGLPVFLVLTKCDRLVAADEQVTFADWVDRIEERKREIHRRFEQFRNRRDA